MTGPEDAGRIGEQGEGRAPGHPPVPEPKPEREREWEPVRAPGSRPGSGPGRAPEPGPVRAPGERAEQGPGREAELLARAALTRVLEPGEERGGRWLREHGAVGLIRLLTGPEREAGGLTGVRPDRLAGYRRKAALADPRRDLALAAAAGGRFVCPGSAEWPTQLDDLADARPVGLWLRGRPDLRTWALRSVAVVGARACTPYGAHMAQTLAAGLAERGWVVVSGAAYGIDGAAHRGALASGGATAAVLACGVDVSYPRGHAGLLGRIAGQGLVLGELPPGSHPTPSRFVLRNRVIAALTRGTVVVEAAHRSGSLVTARRAQQLGRFTMGVPGPATSGLSAGVHELLRGEAVLVSDAAEVAELVGSIGELAPERRGPVLARDLLDRDTARVLEALPAGRPVGVEELALASGTGADDVIGRLYELHSLGFVERQGDVWQLSRQTPGAGMQTGAARRGGR